MHLIREELQQIRDDHNKHIIPGSRNRGNGPSGRPDSMYTLPHLYGANYQDQLVSIPSFQEEIDEFSSIISFNSQDFSDAFKEFACSRLDADNISQEPPETVIDATYLYFYLLNKIDLIS